MGEFSMLEVHRALLTHNRMFLLRNIFPSEEFWSLLQEKELLTASMLEDIQSCPKTSTRISTLLDILPRRGPDAFDLFIEALLESTQSHVAEKLKEQEATDQFQRGLKFHCQSEHSLQMFTTTFQQSMRKLEHFREQKFEVILDEQGTALEKLEEDCSQAQQEVEQLRNCLRQCSKITEAVAATVSGGFLSPLAVFDLQRQFDTFLSWLEVSNSQHVCGIHGSLQVIVSYLRGNAKGFSGQKTDHSTQTEEVEVGGQLTESVRKLQLLRQNIDRLVTSAATRDSIPGSLVETELETIASSVGELIQDVQHTERHLRRMQHETLSELYSCQEVARLQQEQRQLQENLTEQVEHLRQMKQKTQNHPRQLQQLREDIGQKELQLTRTQQDLQCRLQSAGRYRRLLYDLLPNCGTEEEEDTKWQTREKATQTPVTSHNPASNRTHTHPLKQTAPSARDKDHKSHPKAKPQKPTVPNKGRTLNKLRPESVDTQKHIPSEHRDSDVGETPRSNRDITAEKATHLSHYDSLGQASKRQSETYIRLPSTHRSDSDTQYKTQQSSSLLFKQSPPSTESDHSNVTTARTAQGTSELKADVVGTKYKSVVQPESMKMKPVMSKAKVKQKFKLRSSVSKQEIDNKETIYEEKGPHTRRGSLTINNLEMFGSPANGLSENRRRHARLDTLNSTTESNFDLTKEDLAELCVCRLESDGYRPSGCTGPCQVEEGNWKKGKPSRVWKHRL